MSFVGPHTGFANVNDTTSPSQDEFQIPSMPTQDEYGHVPLTCDQDGLGYGDDGSLFEDA